MPLVQEPSTALLIRTVAAVTVEESEEPEDPEEVLISGIAATQSPTLSSLALADTCWVNRVYAVQVTAT